MDEDRLTELLGRYRPAGPPRDLRDRALLHRDVSGRTWPWAVAAAALLAATLGLHVAASTARQGVAAPTAIDAEVFTALGGDEEARQAVRLMLDEQAYRAWLAPRAAVSDEMGGVLNGGN